MLNIVIPMAGRGSRFSKAGYKDPKPLIPVSGVPMINLVVRNLTPLTPHRFTFICQQEHVARYGLIEHLNELTGGCNISVIDGITDGAACTVLKAREHIDPSEPLMIANSDQYVDCSIDDYLHHMDNKKLDGLIMTMRATDPKWSFVGMKGEAVERVVEKEVISTEATVGIYNFRQAGDFIEAAENMIEKDLRVNGEFYVAPVYNDLISGGYRVGVYNIGSERDGMYGLGIPEDLDFFITTGLCKRHTTG